MLIAEVVILFVLTLGLSVVRAVADLSLRVVGFPASTNVFLIAIPGHPALSAALGSAYLVVQTAGVIALVGYLLYRSGEGASLLGVSLSQKRRDLLLVVPYALAAIGMLRLSMLLPGLGGETGGGSAAVPLAYSATGVLRALNAGIVEELVVLAFVMVRLRQLGLPPLLIIVASCVLRASYHVEYGLGVVSILFFGAGMAVMYLLTRRLLPAIGAHTGYDLWAIFNSVHFG